MQVFAACIIKNASAHQFGFPAQNATITNSPATLNWISRLNSMLTSKNPGHFCQCQEFIMKERYTYQRIFCKMDHATSMTISCDPHAYGAHCMCATWVIARIRNYRSRHCSPAQEIQLQILMRFISLIMCTWRGVLWFWLCFFLRQQQEKTLLGLVVLSPYLDFSAEAALGEDVCYSNLGLCNIQ